ncbi:ShlB/FhaC/HecB family hemolysin secretion/activation protein [Derxia lacustris]|uniref:ShlB/FhaC/HecB family hemolysin secretion/activation protein n=1 Tax=Derxia lacustris TaxID=764842 RepID=UPI001593848A|nr:ShlB/FhaC/HecB family hemolysin secretion/activation protein [Derxia lacustris]
MNKNNRLPLRRRAALLGALSPLLLASAAQAQNAPAAAPAAPGFGIGDALKEGQPQGLPVERTPPRLRIGEPDQAPLALPGGATLHVERFRIEGDASVADDEAQAELASLRGRDLSFAQLQDAALRITALYRRHGLLLARAYLPQQDASDGTLTIQVLAGRFGVVTVRNATPVRDSLIAAPFERLPESQAAVSRAALERAMLLAGELPGASLPRVTVRPGETAGSSDFLVEVDAGPRFDGYALGDNYGSRFTGHNRLGLGGGVNSPLGLGDRLSASAMVAAGSRLLSGRAAYSLPLNSDGLRAEVAASKTTYELGAEFNSLRASGESHGAEVNLAQALLRSRDSRIDLKLGLATRHLVDKVETDESRTPKRAQTGSLTLGYDDWAEALGRPARRNASLSYLQGHLAFDDAAQLADNRKGADTAGSYARLAANLGGSIEPLAGWTVVGQLSGQKALHGKNLDASEQFAASGANGVRAYREWISGDNGWLASATLRRALPALGPAAHWIGVFADSGRVRSQKLWSAAPDGSRLSDAGLAWRADWGPALMQLQWARAIGPRPASEPTGSRQRLLFQLGTSF